MDNLPLKFVIFIFFFTCCSVFVQSQQPYIGKVTTDCNNRNESTTALGYQCNGQNRSCQAYLTFISQPPFDSVSSISTLLGADPSELSRLNSVSRDATFETSKSVLAPVTCSCAGSYYQANTTYVVQSLDTYLSIANSILRGLTTCQALIVQNSNVSSDSLFAGTRINVPLRCACPTNNQTDDGVNYLLSYVIAEGQWVEMISSMFGVDTVKTLEANGLSVQDATVFPNTTLLVPLQNPPTSLDVLAPPPPPPAQQPPSTPVTPPPGGGSSKTWIYAVIGTLGGLLIVLASGILIFCFYCRKRRKEGTDKVVTSQSIESIEKPINQKNDENSEINFSESISSLAQSLKVYKYGELQLATENFSPNCRIKGSVYRGLLNGDFAAVKKMSGDVSEEINLLNKINHLNLIRLSGVCFNDGHWYLVYEYAEKGPLSDWIYGNQGNKNFLNWTQRIQIGLDVATGLNYLHSYTSPPCVHKDLKSSNVLLDGDFRAKISNFSLARSTTDGQGGEFALTRHIVGTKGYMAPEYIENGLISPKLDVYAFGVLMLEILTGKEASVLYEGMKAPLAEILTPVLQDDHEKDKILSGFLDPSLKENYPSDLAISVLRLINSCLKNDPSGRPTMHEIVQFLSTII